MCRSLTPRLRALEERGADAVTLPRLFDAEGGLRLFRETGAEPAQFACPPHHAVDEETVDHGVETDRKVDVIADEIVRHSAAEPVAAAFAVKT